MIWYLYHTVLTIVRCRDKRWDSVHPTVIALRHSFQVCKIDEVCMVPYIIIRWASTNGVSFCPDFTAQHSAMSKGKNSSSLIAG